MTRRVADYLKGLSPRARTAVNEMRAIVKETAPTVTERISYGIPTFDLDGRWLVYVAGWERHVSLYPVTPAMVRALKKDLAPYRSGKGTLRFPLDRPLPRGLIRRIVRLRVAERRAG